jgi:4-amino-4-deoxy-L-arabinose transferase-like glycosyltransferase
LPSPATKPGIALVLAVALGLLRLVHLTADTPYGLTEPTAGVYVDEGYKTLSPRNLIQHGRTHWNTADSYPGWLEASPLTQWSFYVGFRLFGVDIGSARLVTIAYFTILLCGYVWAMAGRYHTALLLAGLVALGLESTIFFFSRVALFETPQLVFVYLLLFWFSRMREGRGAAAIALAVGVALTLTFTVKHSALLVMGPVLLAAAVYTARRTFDARTLWILAALVAAVIVAVLALTVHSWSTRMQLAPLGFLERLMDIPLAFASPFVLVAGWLCALHALLTRPQLWLNDLYRLCLTAIVVLGPLELALFWYNPLRYFVPFLPAYVLLVLEWVHLAGWREQLLRRVPLTRSVLAVGALACALYWSGTGVMRLLALNPPYAPLYFLEPRPNQSLWLLSGVAAVVALGLWVGRSRMLRPTIVRGIAGAIALLFLTATAYTLGSFWLAPSYRSAELRHELTALIPPGSSLAGDWAPFVTLGTQIKPLYMNSRLNRPSQLKKLRPDYLLYCETFDAQAVMVELAGVPGVALSEPLLASEYNGRRVILYALHYDVAPDDPPLSAADEGDRGPAG